MYHSQSRILQETHKHTMFLQHPHVTNSLQDKEIYYPTFLQRVNYLHILVAQLRDETTTSTEETLRPPTLTSDELLQPRDETYSSYLS